MLILDPRLKAALTDDTFARALLSELHQRILTTRDPIQLPQLLGKYLLVSSGRAGARTAMGSILEPAYPRLQQPTTQRETRRVTTISNICKTAHDVAMNTINNMK